MNDYWDASNEDFVKKDLLST
ncbi:hypothetical protein SNEBB_001162, partial [Seison nebaliae]